MWWTLDTHCELFSDYDLYMPALYNIYKHVAHFILLVLVTAIVTIAVSLL